MRKFTKLMLTFALLVGVMGGANSVKAEKVKIYSKGFTEVVGGNCSYDGDTKKFSWTAQYSNAVTVLEFAEGLLPYISHVKLHVDDISEGGQFRVMIDCGGSNQRWITVSSTGDIDLSVTDFQKWGTKITNDEIAVAYRIRLSGSDDANHVGDWVKIDPTSIYLETSWEAPMNIASAADWKGFSKFILSGYTSLNALLTADFEVTDGTMIGDGSSNRNAENPKAYSGTFDGQNHTITFNSEKATAAVTAPFRFVKNATIKNLKTAGSMSSTNNIMGGIVGYAQGEVLIDNCGSSMNLTTDDTANDATIGGILGLQDQDPTTVTISNCLYTGTLTGDHGVSGIAGYMRNGGGATISNVLYAGSYVTSNETPANMANIVRGGGTLTNCYYVNKIHNSTDGTKADAADLASGKIAYILQGEQATQYWGQGFLNSSKAELLPSLTSDASKKVYREENNDYFANINGMLPDPVKIGKLAWKFAASPEAPYEVTLPEAKASNFQLIGTSDKYPLIVTAAGATTLVLPFDVAEAELPENVKAFELTYENDVIKATEVTSITADHPVLINAPKGQYNIVSGENYGHEFNFSNRTTTNGVLTGVYNTELPYSYVPADSYVLQNGADGLGFYKVDAANTIKITSFRAYLTVPTSARSLKIVYGDETTGISTTKTESTKNNEIYNLNGQRVSKAQKGLYIVNGKKVVRK